MKTIFRIARLELSLLFFSPIAWLVLVIFIIQSGVTFLERLEGFSNFQSLGNQLHSLTESIFASEYRGFFKNVQSNLYLYMPLLTMGLMSRELSSGTIKLLFSSPVRVAEIVLGKYLAIITYGFLLVVILAMFGGVGYSVIESMDITLVLSGILGLYMLICAYAAIGLFMSCLTSYQVVAAIATLVVFAALNYIGTIGQHIDFVRDITYFLSIAGRTDEFIGGLVTSKDVLYFVIVIALFLTFSILSLQAGRESKPVFVKIARYTVVVVVALAIGYISARPRFIAYYDATATDSRTLTAGSRTVVRQMNKPLKITAFVNLIDQNAPSMMPLARMRDLAMFEKYTRFLPDMEMEYVYYYDSLQGGELYDNNQGLTNKALAEKVATVYKFAHERIMSPEAMRERIDLSSEGNRVVRQLEYDGKKTFLRIFNDLMRQPGEQEITAALKRLATKPVKVAVLTGEHERSTAKMGDREYRVMMQEQTFRNALINQGFDVDTVSVSGGRPLPEDIAVLIVADPLTPFSAPALAGLRRYIDAGGNLLILGEPGKRAILEPLTSLVGVHYRDGMVIQDSEDFAPDFVIGEPVQPDTTEFPSLQAFYKRHAEISMPGAASFVVDSGAFKVFHLLSTQGPKTWHTLEKPNQDGAPMRYIAERGDLKGPLPLVTALTRNVNGKQQRIIVAADADMLSNGEIFRRTPPVQNFYFAAQLFHWFCDGAYPVDTTRPETADNKLEIDKGTVTKFRAAFVFILPALLIAAGSLFLIVRRKR